MALDNNKMIWQFTPYLLPPAAAAVFGAALAYYAWRQRPVPGSLAIMLLALAIAQWSLGYTMEIAAVTLPSKVFLAKLQYLGIVTAPVAWFILAQEYTGQGSWLKRNRLALLLVIPLITLLLLWIQEPLIWQQTRLNPAAPIPTFDPVYGPWFWVHSFYSYLLMLAGSLLLVRTAGRRFPLYHWQTAVLLLSAFLPWLANALYIFGQTALDLTPFGFALSGILFATAIWRFHLLDIAPVARQTIIDNMSDAVFVLDNQDRVVDANLAAQEIAGLESRRLIGRPFNRLFKTSWELLIPAGGTGESYAEITLGEGNGQRNYDLRTSVLYDRAKRPRGRVVVLRDISERKRMEQYLMRTEPLVAMGRMAAVMAHEIRNPLHAIRGFLELVLEFDLAPEEQENYLRFCYTELERLTETTDRMLNFANPHPGVHEAVSLTDLLQRTLALVDQSLTQARISLAVNNVAAPLLIEVIPAQMVQVLLNLLINAIEATAEGGQIDVTIERDQDQARLTVTNYGVTIPPENLAHIFDPFFTTKEQGGGLGLAVSKSIVEEHGGLLTARNLSSEDGVAFTIELPLATEKQ